MGYLSARKIGEKDSVITEIKQLIAFLFQRSGRENLRAQDIYMTLSYELGWMTPGDAKKFVTQALEQGLLKEMGEGYFPTFDYRKVDIPLGYHIDGAVVQELSVIPTSENIVADVVTALTNAGINERRVREQIKITAQHQHIIPEAAAIVIARRYNLDSMPYHSRAWDAVKKL